MEIIFVERAIGFGSLFFIRESRESPLNFLFASFALFADKKGSLSAQLTEGVSKHEKWLF